MYFFFVGHFFVVVFSLFILIYSYLVSRLPLPIPRLLASSERVLLRGNPSRYYKRISFPVEQPKELAISQAHKLFRVISRSPTPTKYRGPLHYIFTTCFFLLFSFGFNFFYFSPDLSLHCFFPCRSCDCPPFFFSHSQSWAFFNAHI